MLNVVPNTLTGLRDDSVCAGAGAGSFSGVEVSQQAGVLHLERSHPEHATADLAEADDAPKWACPGKAITSAIANSIAIVLANRVDIIPCQYYRTFEEKVNGLGKYAIFNDLGKETPVQNHDSIRSEGRPIPARR